MFKKGFGECVYVTSTCLWTKAVNVYCEEKEEQRVDVIPLSLGGARLEGLDKLEFFNGRMVQVELYGEYGVLEVEVGELMVGLGVWESQRFAGVFQEKEVKVSFPFLDKEQATSRSTHFLVGNGIKACSITMFFLRRDVTDVCQVDKQVIL